MTTSSGPHDLTKTPLIMTPTGKAVTKSMSDHFFADLDRDFDNFKNHILVMTFAFDEAWPTWEMHPHGDEFVYLLEGDADFLLRMEGEEHRVRINEPGTYVLVPKGVWHTARPHAPTRLLFVTPGEGTLNQVSPDEA
jgi:mannose-6-phosphate isomerase-like protein (cupin superfamily)